jgi:outer membrane protein TolC
MVYLEMKKRLLFIVLITGVSISLHAESSDTTRITLPDAIERGIRQSVDAVVMRNEFMSSYWEYRTFKAELLPVVSLTGTIPYYSKSYNIFQNSDGTQTFVSNDYSRIDAGLSVSQNIPWTGGILSLESSLERLEQYGDNSAIQYMSLPGFIKLEQPVFGFNSVRWMQKIEPVKYKEAKQKLIAETENVSNTVISNYFNLLLGEINFQSAEQNLHNARKLYTIAEARRKIGQISENDLLQLKVSLLNAEANYTNAQSSLKSRMFKLRSFLGYKENITLSAILPNSISDTILFLNYDHVLTLANVNNPFTQNIQRRRLEASREVNRAKADRWNITVFASFGLSGQDDSFSQAFNSNNWRSSQKIEVGISIPILDWGKGKGRVKVAESNREVINSTIEKEIQDFHQDIFILVENFNNQSRQVKIAAEADRVAGIRYESSVEAFILGKIDVLNLNDAQRSKDESRRNYVEQLFLLWSYYYQIRGLTLYDFVNNTEITVDEKEMLNNKS